MFTTLTSTNFEPLSHLISRILIGARSQLTDPILWMVAKSCTSWQLLSNYKTIIGIIMGL